VRTIKQVVMTAAALKREDCRSSAETFPLLCTPALLAGMSAAVVSACHRRDRAALAFVGVLAVSEGRTVADALATTLPVSTI
jgi:hypothetical protein